MKASVEDEIKKCHHYSVMVDNAIKETEAVIVRIVKEKKTVNRLLGLAQLNDAHADGFLEAVSNQFLKVNQNSLCTHGAVVNHAEK